MQPLKRASADAWSSILENQNKAGSDSEKGFIWILNTSVTFCAEYKFFWEIN